MNEVLVPISEIMLGDRQRTDMGDMDSLAFSIDNFGLKYPIIVERITDEKYKYRLIDGGRRLAAYQQLDKQEIPVLFNDTLDDIGRKELELETNIRRKQFSWFEEAKAEAEINILKCQKYNEGLVSRLGIWKQKDTAEALCISPA